MSPFLLQRRPLSGAPAHVVTPKLQFNTIHHTEHNGEEQFACMAMETYEEKRSQIICSIYFFLDRHTEKLLLPS